jgi:septal ring factor EnvC (AmiA/AmiB activator)
MALSNNFASNRGKLPWPVDNGYVSIQYGTYEIPGTKIKGDNPGITINTPSPGTTVKAVFDGEVIGVFNLGDGMAVTISHGKYFTTYSNLSGVSVSKGTQVQTGQAIGRAGVDDEGGTASGSILFMLQVGMNGTNPRPWLRPS